MQNVLLTDEAAEEIANEIVSLIIRQKTGESQQPEGELDDYVPSEFEIKFLSQADKVEKDFIKSLQEIFDKQRREVLSLLKRTPKSYISKAKVDEWIPSKREWDRIMRDMGKPFVETAYLNGGNLAYDKLGLGISFDVKQEAAIEFIDGRTFKFAEDVNHTTQEALRRTFKEGLDAGESIPDLRKRVGKVFDNASKNRALKIARSETIRASNRGAIEGYIRSGVVEGKEWLATADDRTCPWCVEMNGRTMKGEGALEGAFWEEGEKMIVGEKEMLFDYEAIVSPPLHVLCRCTLLPITREAPMVSEAAVRREDNGILKAFHKDGNEHSVTLDGAGKVILRQVGTKKTIRVSPEQMRKIRESPAVLDIHNHPNGASFSKLDIVFANRAGIMKMRVVSDDYIYEIYPKELKRWPTEKDVKRVYDRAFEDTKDKYIEIYERTGDYRGLWQSQSHEIWQMIAKKLGLIYKRVKVK